MKKTLLVFSILLTPFLLFSKTKNILASSAGTMSLVAQEYCDGEVAFPAHNADESLDAGDLLKFVIHDNSGASLGNMFGGQGDLNTAYGIFPGMTAGTTYYISAIAGMDDGTGKVDLTDPELSVAQGTPVTFFGPILTVLQDAICDGEVLFFNGLTCQAPGPYTVVLTAANGCDSVVTLNLEVLNPVAGVLPPDDITCFNTTVTLLAVVTDPALNVSYIWSGPCLLSNNGSPTMDVDCAGTYQLVVSKTDFGITCFSDPFVVTVNENSSVPIADAGNAQVLDCNSPSAVLGGAGTSIGVEFVYAWTGANGFTSNVLNPLVTAPGQYCLSVVNTITGCQSTDCVTISVDIVPPVAEAGNDQVLNCTNSVVILDGSGSSLGSEFDYTWDLDGAQIANSLTLQATVEGVYCLTVTNVSNGCTSSDCVTVTSDGSIPVVNVSTNGTLTCDVGQVDIIAQTFNCNNCTFIWSDGSQNPTLTTSIPGIYTVTVTDNSTGCTTSGSAVVVENIDLPIVSIASSNIINCVNSCVTLDGSGSSSGADFSYSWFDWNDNPIPNFTQAISVCNAGNYTLIVTNNTNGCSSSASVDVLINIDAPIADAGPDQVIDCSNQSVTLDGTASSGSGILVFEWMDDTGASIGTANTLTVSIPGTYTLIVTDTDNGCESSSSVVVTGDGVLGVDLGDDLIFDCTASEMIILGVNIPTGPGFTYQWTTTDGMIISGINSPNPTVNLEGTYHLSVNDSASGCSGTDQITIVYIEDVYEVNAIMNLNCDTNIPNVLDASLLYSSFNLSYQWTTGDGQIISGENTLNPVVGSVGTYDLIVTDVVSGCSSMATVLMEDLPIPTAVIDSPDGLIIDCQNTALVLDAGNSIVNPPATFEWSMDGITVGNDIVLTITTPGTYDLMVLDGNGCSDMTSVVVTGNLDPPSFTLINTVVLDCANNFTQEIGPQLSGINPNEVTYQWSGTNNFMSSDSSVVFNSLMEGVYEVTVTDVNNSCEDSGIMQVFVNGFDFDISTTVAGCDMEDGTATVTTGLSNSLVEWSTGEQGSMISNLAQGWYSVTLTDVDNNCSQQDNFFVEEDISCKVVIAGYVVEDPNNTCTYDGSMTGLECVLVKLDPLGIFTMTDSTGYYEFIVDDGTYSVLFIGSPEATLSCPIPGVYDVVLDVDGTVSDGNHFFVERPSFDLCISKFTANARPGFAQFNCIQICNYSDSQEDAVATFMHDSIFSNQIPWPFISPANNNPYAGGYSYDAATNTFTWNLDDMEPGECRKIMWYMTVPVSTPLGTQISTSAKVNPINGDVDPDNNCLDWNQIVTGSYDPNDKRNFTGLDDWGGAIYEDDVTMEYVIRFQNVGTDTAFTVVVRDTLDDAHLDVTSIRAFTSSHDMQVEFEENNVLIFRFEDILLVDSFTNEPASNGWVSFDIDRLPGQDFGTEITNQAAIYFDYNEPVITNEVVNILTEPTSVFYPKENGIDVQIIPNITNENVLLQYVLENPSPISVRLHNAKGKLMQDFNFGKKQTGQHSEVLNLKTYPSGVYFIFVKTEEGSAVRRVVKL